MFLTSDAGTNSLARTGATVWASTNFGPDIRRDLVFGNTYMALGNT
jgi:hypothetical protein